MTKSLKTTLLLLFLFQVIISGGFDLAHDEAYYWLYSKNLDWGYFDHPPFVGFVIRFFSFLPHTEWSVRLGFIILQFLALALLMAITAPTWIVALLFFSFPLASFTGLLALPDIPLLFMSACYCLCLKRYLDKDSHLNAALLGIVIALLFYAKYHGVLLVFFTVLAIPRLFLKKSFYLVACVALLAFLPHLLWQYDHDFSTLRYHFIERPSSSFSFKRSLEFIGLQALLAGVLAGPLVWWTVFQTKAESSFSKVMKYISIGTVIFFLISSFSKKVEANWTIFLAVPLIYLAHASSIWKKKWPRNLLYVSCGLVVFARLLFILPTDLVTVKRLREFHGWPEWAQMIQEKCQAPILANSYQIASKLSFYLRQEINALNYHSRKNQFDYWRFDKKIPTKEVCYITDSSEFQGEKVVTPEGKSLKVIDNLGLERLWALKYEYDNR